PLMRALSNLFFQAEDGIRFFHVTGVQTCALPIFEAYIAPEQGSLVTGFANAPKATLYGGEAEVQYNYDLVDLGGWFANKELVVRSEERRVGEAGSFSCVRCL